MDHRSLILFASVIAFAVAGTSALAEDGVTKDRIVFGQVAALEGPAQALGQGMRQGLLAAFAEVNRAGGVTGRQLELKSADDSYEPQKTIEAMKKMLAEEKVFAIVGAVGTPTSNAGQPIATEAKVPFIGPFTGAEFLRSPYKRYVVNIRSSYFQETQAWIEHLTKDLGITKIAILYQDDTFGLAGLDGVKMAMAKRNMSFVAAGTFRRNTTAVKSALLEIMKANPEAVVTVGPYKPVAEFIKLARQAKMDAVFVAISFVGSDALALEMGDKGAGVIVSQVVPFPADKSVPLVASYQAALAAHDPAGRWLVQARHATYQVTSRPTFLTQADRNGKGRAGGLSGLSTIRARLYIALGFMAITTVICSLIGLYAFTNIGGTVTKIVSQ